MPDRVPIQNYYLSVDPIVKSIVIDPKIDQGEKITDVLVEDNVEKVTKASEQKFDYVVLPGDTLFAIGTKFGVHYQELAKINQIKTPYTIYPNQSIKVKTIFSKQKRVKEVLSSTNSNNNILRSLNWMWPVEGTLLDGEKSDRGIELLTSNKRVHASEAGNVLYSGEGLKHGFPKLVVIRHNKNFLSAYGVTSEYSLQVNEGDSIRAGEVIAQTSEDLHGKAKVHFQIRETGKAINPLKLLPQ